jgi:hypothetical protein
LGTKKYLGQAKCLSHFNGRGMKNRINSIIICIFIISILLSSCRIEIPTTEIHLTNSSTYPLTAIYIAEKDSGKWSDNLIVDPVQTGETRIITGVARLDSEIKSVFSSELDSFENILYYDLSIISVLHLDLNGE